MLLLKLKLWLLLAVAFVLGHVHFPWGLKVYLWATNTALTRDPCMCDRLSTPGQLVVLPHKHSTLDAVVFFHTMADCPGRYTIVSNSQSWKTKTRVGCNLNVYRKRKGLPPGEYLQTRDGNTVKRVQGAIQKGHVVIIFMTSKTKSGIYHILKGTRAPLLLWKMRITEGVKIRLNSTVYLGHTVHSSTKPFVYDVTAPVEEFNRTLWAELHAE